MVVVSCKMAAGPNYLLPSGISSFDFHKITFEQYSPVNDVIHTFVTVLFYVTQIHRSRIPGRQVGPSFKFPCTHLIKKISRWHQQQIKRGSLSHVCFQEGTIHPSGCWWCVAIYPFVSRFVHFHGENGGLEFLAKFTNVQVSFKCRTIPVKVQKQFS